MSQHEEKHEGNELKGVAIPMRWKSTKDILTVYANHLMMTHAGGEFYLIFGELLPPVILDSEKDKLPEYVEIIPVAKVVVTPENMMNFAKAIQVNLENFMSRAERSDKVE